MLTIDLSAAVTACIVTAASYVTLCLLMVAHVAVDHYLRGGLEREKENRDYPEAYFALESISCQLVDFKYAAKREGGAA